MIYLKSYNESLRDKMIPKSDEEILNKLSDLTPNELLMKSIENNYFKGVKIALERGANVNDKDNYGDTPLKLASEFNRKDIAEFLIKNGADINDKNKYNNTILHYANKYGDKDMVELLKKYGATE